jgi:hypothetical protein
MTRHTARVLDLPYERVVTFPGLPPVRTLDAMSTEEVWALCHHYGASSATARFEFRL